MGSQGPADPFDLRVLSLGAGVQSTTLYRMAALGEIGPRPDLAIFADTQQEPPWVYENLESLRGDHGDTIPIRVVSAGDLGSAVQAGVNSTGGRFASVPFWVEGSDGREALGRRQCTREYKIDVVKRAVRDALGLKKRQRAAGRFRVEEWVGISTDEATRMKPSRYPWITTRWPLIEERMSRQQCKEWLVGNGFSVPGKSACVFCPYRKPAEWAGWRQEHPELFEAACRWDDLIRSQGTLRGMRSQQYVLRLLVPLRELPSREVLEGDGRNQLNLFENECEGMCGV